MTAAKKSLFLRHLINYQNLPALRQDTTNLLNHFIHEGNKVHKVDIHDDWLEIDSKSDLELYLQTHMSDPQNGFKKR